MDQKVLIEKIMGITGLNKDSVTTLYDSFATVIEDCLASGDTVSIPSFGNFEPRKRKERIMAHPSSPGKRLLVPPKMVVSFKPSNNLKNKINAPKGDE